MIASGATGTLPIQLLRPPLPPPPTSPDQTEIMGITVVRVTATIPPVSVYNEVTPSLTNGAVTITGGAVAQGDMDGDGRFLASDAFGWIDSYANNQATPGDYDAVPPPNTPNDLELLRRGDCASPHDSRLTAGDYFSVLDLIQGFATTCPP